MDGKAGCSAIYTTTSSRTDTWHMIPRNKRRRTHRFNLGTYANTDRIHEMKNTNSFIGSWSKTQARYVATRESGSRLQYVPVVKYLVIIKTHTNINQKNRQTWRLCQRYMKGSPTVGLNFAHKLSRNLVHRFRLISFEDLNTKGMVKNYCLSKSIYNIAWNQLVQLIQSKAAEAGSCMVLVDPHNTSQICSGCGQIVQKELNDRVYKCPYWGLVTDRDVNAA